MAKKLPDFKSDAEAAKFLEQTDLSDYLTQDNLFNSKFEFLPKDKKISLRCSEVFLDAIRDVAEEQGMSYHKYIRMAVEKSLQQDSAQQ